MKWGNEMNGGRKYIGKSIVVQVECLKNSFLRKIIKILMINGFDKAPVVNACVSLVLMCDDDASFHINKIQHKFRQSIARIYSKDRQWRLPFDFSFACKEFWIDSNCIFIGVPTSSSAATYDLGISQLTILVWCALVQSPGRGLVVRPSPRN